MKTKENKEIQKVALRMIATIDKAFDELSDKAGHEFADTAYNAVAMTMVVHVCASLAKNRGKKAYQQYWEEVTEIMNGLVEQLACEETRH
jgi:hypothetical protein